MSGSFDPMNITLTERQSECLIYIEQEFFLSGYIPTEDKLVEVFGMTKATVKKWLASPEFQHILKSKGIINSSTEGVLTAPQMYLANAILNLADKRSEREKCLEAGVTVQQLAAWRRDPSFIDYVQRRAKAMFENSDDVAYLAVMKNMQGGSLEATKFYFEMTGKWQPSVRHDVNIDSLAVRLIEIIAIHVTDADKLEAIAADFERVMNPQAAQEVPELSAPIPTSGAAVHRPLPVGVPVLANPSALPSFGGDIEINLGSVE